MRTENSNAGRWKAFKSDLRRAWFRLRHSPQPKVGAEARRKLKEEEREPDLRAQDERLEVAGALRDQYRQF